jgi:integrase
VWIGQFYVHGRQRQRVLGRVRKDHERSGGGLSRTQAEKALRDVRARVEQEVAIAPRGSIDLNVQFDAVSIAVVADMHLRWLESKGRKARTIEGYREMIGAHIAAFFKDLNVESITHRDVEAFIDYLRSIGRKPETIKNYVNLLQAIFSTAVRRGIVSDNPVLRADNKPTGSNHDGAIRYLRMADVDALIRAELDDDLGMTMRTVYIVATMTGLRLGELRALTWENVDFVASKVRVERSYSGGRLTTPKSKRSQRAVPMPTRVAQALAQHSQRTHYSGDEDLVCCHPHHGSFLSDQTMRDRFNTARDAAGVRKVRFHDLRHTYGTLMASAGVPLRVLQGLMGHASYSTTEVYAKWAPDQTAELAFAERAFASSERSESPDTWRLGR